MWSGTNSSCVSIFILHIPQPNPTSEEAPRPIMGQLAKEIQIKHKAPVVAISLFDAVRFTLLENLNFKKLMIVPFFIA